MLTPSAAALRLTVILQPILGLALRATFMSTTVRTGIVCEKGNLSLNCSASGLPFYNGQNGEPGVSKKMLCRQDNETLPACI